MSGQHGLHAHRVAGGHRNHCHSGRDALARALKAKERANRTVCKSNMRQVGFGALMYAMDNQDHLPNNNWPNTGYHASLVGHEHLQLFRGHGQNQHQHLHLPQPEPRWEMAQVQSRHDSHGFLPPLLPCPRVRMYVRAIKALARPRLWDSQADHRRHSLYLLVGGHHRKRNGPGGHHSQRHLRPHGRAGLTVSGPNTL